MTSQHEPSLGRSEACANIALAKYWGKAPTGPNLTAVPSLSLTLDALRTRTEVRLDASLPEDQVFLNGVQLTEKSSERVRRILAQLRKRSTDTRPARVESYNNFPTAAGLASSASGFAAFVVAASQALHLPLDLPQLSSDARSGSASAGRSLFGGFVELLAETESSTPLAPPDHWKVCMIVAVVEAGEKSTSSTLGMIHTAQTSPYYPAWVERSPAIFQEIKQGVLERDFERVALYMEHSTRLMHATMLTSLPPVLYLQAPTIELMHAIAERRRQGHPEAYTMDAGPNVKVLTTQEHAEQTISYLRSVPGVSQVLCCQPGPGAALLALEGPLSDAARQVELT